jgi:hypothetical protein
MSRVSATLKGVVSVRELAASQANLDTLRAQQNAPPIELPRRRLRDGSLTSAPSLTTLESLPTTPAPSADVVSSAAASALFASVTGFTGIHEGDNVTANGFESEPPDQGLAVNNNVVAEINNDVTRFFDATTGAPLTGPIANSTFFLASGFDLSDTQAFFDSHSRRWFLDTIMGSGTTLDFGMAVSQTSDPLGNYWVYPRIQQ